MSDVLFTLQAVDSWFFRDGTPFGEGITVATGIRGTFPPPIQTLQGAVRTGLARANGWDLRHPLDWPHGLGAPDGTGPLQFVGPLLMRGGEEPLWPVPRVLWRGDDGKLTRLLPGPPLETDLGRHRLPLAPRGKRVAVGWVTAVELSGILADTSAVPTHVVTEDELYRSELHVGIQREGRRVKDGGLYLVHHARPEPDVRVALVMRHCPPDVAVPDRMTWRLGGEGRAAAVMAAAVPSHLWPALPPLAATNGVLRYCVSLLTDAAAIDARLAMTGPSGAPGYVVSASVGPGGRVGGYDLQARAPRPLRTTLPAGTTWFMEADADDREAVEALHGTSGLGQSNLGEGWMAVGRWEDGQ